jgi:predicted AAA+ superfamily ATPase
MHGNILKRALKPVLEERLNHYPVVVLLGARQVGKSPKIYIRDTGILHALLEIENRDQLFSNPIYGASFEAYVIENILVSIQSQNGPQWRSYFFRTSNGAEIDLVLEKGQQRIAIEIKSSTAPKVSRGFWNAIEDINSTGRRYGCWCIISFGSCRHLTLWFYMDTVRM